MELGYTEPDPRDDLSGNDVGAQGADPRRGRSDIAASCRDVASSRWCRKAARDAAAREFVAGSRRSTPRWRGACRTRAAERKGAALRREGRSRARSRSASKPCRRQPAGRASRGTDNQVVFTRSATGQSARRHRAGRGRGSHRGRRAQRHRGLAHERTTEAALRATAFAPGASATSAPASTCSASPSRDRRRGHASNGRGDPGIAARSPGTRVCRAIPRAHTPPSPRRAVLARAASALRAARDRITVREGTAALRRPGRQRGVGRGRRVRGERAARRRRSTGTALLACRLVAEAAVAGRHLDNIAPSLLGGIALVRSLDPIDVVRCPCPTSWRVALAARAATCAPRRRARCCRRASRAPWGAQMAQVAAMVAALATGDVALLGRALDDRFAEPARAALLPGFIEAKAPRSMRARSAARSPAPVRRSFAIARRRDRASASPRRWRRRSRRGHRATARVAPSIAGARG